MGYTLNSAKDSRGDEHLFMERFSQRLKEILAYQRSRGGDLEGAYQAVTGEPWPAGRSVKLHNGTPEMTKDRTVKSVLGKYVLPAAAGALTGGAGLGAFGGGAAGAGGLGSLAAPLTGAPAAASLTGVGTATGLGGTAVGLGGTAALAGGGGSMLSNLKKGLDVTTGGGSDINWAGLGLGALGDALQAVYARPLFQERSPFTGEALAQRMQEKGIKGMEGLKTQLDTRGPFQFSPDVQADNPMGGMSDDPIRKILQGLR